MKEKPAHLHRVAPTGTTILYIMYSLYSLIYRSYASASVLALTKIGDGSVVATAGFLISLVIFLSSTYIGSIIDKTDRMRAMTNIILIQILSVSLEYSLSGWCITYNPSISSTSMIVLLILPLLTAISSLLLSLCSMSLEKDWVVAFASKDQKLLTTINSTFYQIDLAANSLVPAVIGYLYTSLPNVSSTLVVMLVFNGVTGIAMLYALSFVYRNNVVLHTRSSKFMHDGTKTITATLDHNVNVTGSGHNDLVSDSNNILKEGYGSVFNLMSDLKALPKEVSSSMISHSLLYLNVMSFGSLQTVFMARNGIDEYDIGIAQGAASIIGFIGVSIFPYLKRQISLSTTAICSIWYFSFTCGIGMLFLMLYTPPNVWGFTYAIISSRYVVESIHLCPFNLCKHELKRVYDTYLEYIRCGLWIFDLCTRQIVQENVEEVHRNRTNGHWNSMVSLFDMASFVFALLINGSDNNAKNSTNSSASFILLCNISLGFLLLSASGFAYYNYHSRSDATTTLTKGDNRIRTKA